MNPAGKSLEKWNNCGDGVRGQTITYPSELPFKLDSCFPDSRSYIQGEYWKESSAHVSADLSGWDRTPEMDGLGLFWFVAFFLLCHDKWLRGCCLEVSFFDVNISTRKYKITAVQLDVFPKWTHAYNRYPVQKNPPEPWKCSSIPQHPPRRTPVWMKVGDISESVALMVIHSLLSFTTETDLISPL